MDAHGYDLDAMGMFLAAHRYGLDVTGMVLATWISQACTMHPTSCLPLHIRFVSLCSKTTTKMFCHSQIRAQCNYLHLWEFYLSTLKDLPQFFSVIKGHVTPCSLAFPNPQYLQTPQYGWMDWMDGIACLIQSTFIHARP
jgi:hypothetical protein